MKWTYEPGEPFPVLAMNQQEAAMLADILKRHAQPVLMRRCAKYNDLHESGDATDRQEDLRLLYEERLNLTDRFLSFVDK